MRNALPNAALPRLHGHAADRWRGEDARRSSATTSRSTTSARRRDGATVPLFYENRIPELQLDNPNFNEDLHADHRGRRTRRGSGDEAGARVLGQQYHLITRDDRLRTVAKDIVDHFLGRGFPGKAMVVSIDKATAVRMYDKVQAALGRSVSRRQRGASELRTARADERDLLAPEIALHGEHRHGGGRLAVAERGGRDGGAGSRHQPAPQADGRGGPGEEVQGPARSVPDRRSSAPCG